MKTVPINDFSPLIAPQAENCPDFVVRSAVSATVAEICRETGCLTAETSFMTEPGKDTYELRLGYGLRPELVRFVSCEGMRIRPSTLDSLYHDGAYLGNAGKGIPSKYAFQRPDVLKLVPAPSKEALVSVVLTASIERNTDKIPEQFFNEYADVVVNGALARIYRIAGQTYTNVRLADEREFKYRLALNSIRIETSRDFTRTNGRVFFNRII